MFNARLLEALGDARRANVFDTGNDGLIWFVVRKGGSLVARGTMSWVRSAEKSVHSGSIIWRGIFINAPRAGAVSSPRALFFFTAVMSIATFWTSRREATSGDQKNPRPYDVVTVSDRDVMSPEWTVKDPRMRSSSARILRGRLRSCFISRKARGIKSATATTFGEAKTM